MKEHPTPDVIQGILSDKRNVQSTKKNRNPGKKIPAASVWKEDTTKLWNLMRALNEDTTITTYNTVLEAKTRQAKWWQTSWQTITVAKVPPLCQNHKYIESRKIPKGKN